MDPQQRLVLEVAFEAIQDSANPISAIRGASAGVFIGVSNMEYGLLQRCRDGIGDRHAGTGTVLSLIANRLSHVFDFKGPSLAVDTACSSSLVAVDTACRHLRSGSCGIALAGGVNILLDPRLYLTFCRAHMLSPTGRIRAFDAMADGFVRGEGAGVVVLKPEVDALNDGDKIYAVIRSTAVNQDGGTGTITTPSQFSQISLMREAARASGVRPLELAFVEAHGTGTPVGDPIEAAAIGEVFGGAARCKPLLIGSCKTNIGHLEPAAGIAGLIKTALALRKGRVPPSIGYKSPNPRIDLDHFNLRVATNLEPLAPQMADNFALVNSFGFGGTNACALLQGPPEPSAEADRQAQTPVLQITSETRPTPIPIPLSAPNQAQLQAYAGGIAAALDGGGTLAGTPLIKIAAALAVQRDHFAHRAIILAETVESLRARLQCLAEGKDWPAADKRDLPQIITGEAKGGRKLAFTTTGQGGQWWAMGRRLLETHPQFRSTVMAFDAQFAPDAGWSVVDVLGQNETDSIIDDAAITPAVMFAFQSGLAEIWKSIGVTPELVIGHSFGEVTAAYLAGAVSADHVAHLVKHRGLIRGRVERQGAMAAIGLGPDEIKKLFPADGSIEIGGYNAPNQVTVTGAEESIDTLIAHLQDRDPNILAKKLALDFAYHSSWFEPVEDLFKHDVGHLDYQSPKIPVISTVTGRPQTVFDANYWWRNLRHPVRYAEAVNQALDRGIDTFVELGPHRTLSGMTAACAAAKGTDVVAVSTLYRHWDDFESIACAAAQLYVNGTPIDWTALLDDSAKDVALPQMPWTRKVLWRVPEETDRKFFAATAHPILGVREATPLPTWSNEISLTSHAYLSEHRLNGECVFPAACFIEMMRAVASDVLGTENVEIVDLELTEALYLAGEAEILLRTTYIAPRNAVQIHARRRDGGKDWTLHAEARVLPSDTRIKDSIHSPSEIGIDTDRFYESAQTRGYDYGPSFRGLRRIVRNGALLYGEAEIRTIDQLCSEASIVDPRLLDSCLQLMIADCPSAGQAVDGVADKPYLYFPKRVKRILFSGCPKGPVAVQSRTKYATAATDVRADFRIVDSDA
ncbi:MAG: acyltransferase domain-containing protein, partial [Methyloligellaceae bacterium]